MNLNEDLIISWIGLTALFKNNRMTKGLTYNESVVLLFAYNRFRKTEDATPLQEILKYTRMQKSLLNRTVDALEAKRLIVKKKGEKDNRTLSIQINPNELDTFLETHKQTLKLMDQVIDVVGEDDANAFIRIYNKLLESSIFEKRDQ